MKRRHYILALAGFGLLLLALLGRSARPHDRRSGDSKPPPARPASSAADTPAGATDFNVVEAAGLDGDVSPAAGARDLQGRSPYPSGDLTRTDPVSAAPPASVSIAPGPNPETHSGEGTAADRAALGDATSSGAPIIRKGVKP